MAWRRHVRAQLEQRERRGQPLRALLERHEQLQDRLEWRRCSLEEEGPGATSAARLQHEVEVAELRREREQLRQHVAVLTGVLRELEAEHQEQRGRMGRFAQDLSVLTREYEELQCKCWLLAQEAEGLRGELDEARELLREAQQGRQELEARWVKEKALEAQRTNWANEQEEKYRQKVIHLREMLKQATVTGGL